MREKTQPLATEEHQPTRCGSQHWQISINSRFKPDLKRLRRKTVQNSQASTSLPALSHPGHLHSMSNTGWALCSYTRKLRRPMRSFTCSTEMAEFLVVRPATRDHVLPQVLARGLQSYFVLQLWLAVHQEKLQSNFESLPFKQARPLL